MFAFDKKINEFSEGACDNWSINFYFHMGYLKIYRLNTHAHTQTLAFCFICMGVNICQFHSKEILILV